LKFNFCVGGVWGKFSFLNLTGRIFTANLSGNFQSSVKLGVKLTNYAGTSLRSAGKFGQNRAFLHSPRLLKFVGGGLNFPSRLKFRILRSGR
jgi:hypothetical protein